MIRTLFIIAGAGVVLATGALTGAVALTGNDLKHNDWTWSVTESGGGGGGDFRMERGPEQPDVTRSLAWTGGDRLQIEVPVDVTYVQGAAAGVVVTGPRGLADRIRLIDGRLTMEAAERDTPGEHGSIRWTGSGIRVWNDEERLTVTVTAPSVAQFDLVGSGDVDIRDYDQPGLALTLSGSGDVTAQGSARAVTVDISGSGDADLSALQTVDADIDLSGNGDVRVGPSGRAIIDISGNGDVVLTRRPTTVSQTISGNGDVEER